MSGMSRQTDIKCHIFSEPQACVDFNDDENFRNDRNVKNFRNFRNIEIDRQAVRTDRHQVSYLLESNAQADLNDVGNDRNVGNIKNFEDVLNIRNVRKDIKCHIFLEM